MDFSKMSIEELKALAYDLVVSLQNTQKNLGVVENAIQKKLAEPPKTEPPKHEKKTVRKKS